MFPGTWLGWDGAGLLAGPEDSGHHFGASAHGVCQEVCAQLSLWPEPATSPWTACPRGQRVPVDSTTQAGSPKGGVPSPSNV